LREWGFDLGAKFAQNFFLRLEPVRYFRDLSDQLRHFDVVQILVTKVPNLLNQVRIHLGRKFKKRVHFYWFAACVDQVRLKNFLNLSLSDCLKLFNALNERFLIDRHVFGVRRFCVLARGRCNFNFEGLLRLRFGSDGLVACAEIFLSKAVFFLNKP
jgi:hypothetical protein